MQTTIRNDAPQGSGECLSVVVVTVGDQQDNEARHVLKPGDSVTVEVRGGQFVMVDEKET
ncbi:MAG TPA: hypothetical protein VIN58_00995 [Roseateles sp.]